MLEPDGVRRFILLVASVVLIILAARAAFVSPTGAWPLTALATVAMFFAEIERFESLTLGTSGVSAKMREAKKEIEEALKLNARLLRDLIYQNDMMFGFSDDEKRKYVRELSDSLMRLGVSDAEIKNITEKPQHSASPTD